MRSPSKTLVIRFSSIGDLVLASPLLRVLRTKFPGSEIDMLTRADYADLVRSNPNLNVTFAYDRDTGLRGLLVLAWRLRGEGYDLVVDIHNSLRSRIVRWIVRAPHTVVLCKRIVARTLLVRFKKNIYRDAPSVADRYIDPLRPFGIENDGRGLELHIPDEVQFDVSSRVATLGLNKVEKVIGLCPSARHATKRWPKERYAELAVALINELDAAVLLFGGPDDRELCAGIADEIRARTGQGRAVDLSGALSLLGTAAAMEFCDVIVSNDSGLMHIAAAKQRPLAAIFGSTVREFGFFPLDPHSIVLERQGLDCRPCSHIGRASCPKGHFRCMLETTVEDVRAAVVRLLEAR
jgi:lipopolysaccharide heptosyltransferase II